MFEFEKYEGLGNDFVLVDSSVQITPELAQNVCDRHRGVGADGVLRLSEVPSGFKMEIWNRDGTQPEMCGNGLRCAALWAYQRTGVTEQSWQTAAGLHEAKVELSHDDHKVTVRMAVPSFEPEDSRLRASKPYIDRTLDIGDTSAQVTVVSMGNPHVVLFSHSSSRETLGPKLQHLDLFQEGVNVSFVQAHEGFYDLNVLERGAGWTNACGTAACAVAATLVKTNQRAFGEEFQVRLPGGQLHVSWHSPESGVMMRGAARHVFSGRFLSSAVVE